jgi:hypothetical protein
LKTIYSECKFSLLKRIPLTQGQFTLVDDEDYAELAKFKWYALWSPNSKTFYAERDFWVKGGGGKHKHLKMHRVILGITDSKVQVDHKDHDGLNNQRYNLRPANDRQNTHNMRKQSGDFSSAYKGVQWREQFSRWVVTSRFFSR